MSRMKIVKNNEVDEDKDYVLYWMQASQRTKFNHALELSIKKANELNKPVIVFFGLTDKFPEANLRHYKFMLEGLKDVKQNLKERNIKFVLKKCEPHREALKLSKDACLTITDKSYLDTAKKWKKKFIQNTNCKTIQVEDNVIVPVEEVSKKEEYAARTIRPKIKQKLDKYLKPLSENVPNKSSLDVDIETLDVVNTKQILNQLDIDRSVKPSPVFNGGERKAAKILEDFIENKLQKYSEMSNDPTKDVLSNLSPYLHFGQISPIHIALKVKNSKKDGDDYLEQLIIRRELAINFVHYNQNYDSIQCLPDWAQETLEKHKDDDREYTYTLEEFENAETHDPYWNAAQKEMVKTGKMHSYMRMYWGKKILEWTETPEEGFKIALKLNNRYELDGRNPNGYAGVAWCFGKHDQGWKERPIYGKVRYMNANGLERKFDIEKYVEKIENL